jgi:hypothetical protein
MREILKLAKVRLTAEEIKNEMLLNTGDEGSNAWHIASFRGEVDIMERLCELAKERLATEEIINEILLRSDHEGRNVWHIASFRGDVDVMQ